MDTGSYPLGVAIGSPASDLFCWRDQIVCMCMGSGVFFFIQNGSSFPGRMNMEKINSLKVYKNGCECEVG